MSSLNITPIIGDIISNRYLMVMFKIPKKGHLPTPDQGYEIGLTHERIFQTLEVRGKFTQETFRPMSHRVGAARWLALDGLFHGPKLLNELGVKGLVR